MTALPSLWPAHETAWGDLRLFWGVGSLRRERPDPSSGYPVADWDGVPVLLYATDEAGVVLTRRAVLVRWALAWRLTRPGDAEACAYAELDRAVEDALADWPLPGDLAAMMEEE